MGTDRFLPRFAAGHRDSAPLKRALLRPWLHKPTLFGALAVPESWPQGSPFTFTRVFLITAHQRHTNYIRLGWGAKGFVPSAKAAPRLSSLAGKRKIFKGRIQIIPAKRRADCLN